MEFRILGPLEVQGETGSVGLGGTKPRALLTLLLLHGNQPVSAERLAIDLWGRGCAGGRGQAGARPRLAVAQGARRGGDRGHDAGGLSPAGAPG